MMAPKQLLLVLDNCEHLLGATARLVTRIEQACPDVSVLATSREGLAVEGEQSIALPPLAAGEPGDAIERLVHTDAVSLFVERARRAKADFDLAGRNAGAVVEVCADGRSSLGDRAGGGPRDRLDSCGAGSAP
jgi:predicted ATPase